MAITFTWSVKDMHKVTATGAVYKVDWQCVGTDEDTSISHSRSGEYIHRATVEEVSGEIKHKVTKRAIPNHTAAGFKAYADLTEAGVLAWCKADGEGARIEALITKSINKKLEAPTTSSGVPWAAE
tara:strand:+ start:2405 stop:2782 length:378 start_codon:yes stop_codon:yes gene_type:complete